MFFIVFDRNFLKYHFYKVLILGFIILRPEDITFILDKKKPPIGWVFKRRLFYNTENEEQNVDFETCAFLKAEFPFIFQ